MPNTEKFFGYANLAMFWLGAITIAYLGLAAAGYGLDSSDVDAFKRSGLKVHSDALTGCEYFSTPSGGLTPRLTADGKHIGCRP